MGKSFLIRIPDIIYLQHHHSRVLYNVQQRRRHSLGKSSSCGPRPPNTHPKGSGLLIKNRALAINPVDWKIQDEGYFLKEYPNVLGSDICGTVETVGLDVGLFQTGDRVTGYAASIANSEMDHGALQQYTLLNENVTTKIPDEMSFEEGAILPMSIVTAGVAVFHDLAVCRKGRQSGGFLVGGASSSVGSAAVQIARLLGFTVYAVCSPHRHSKAREYGASHVFDSNDANVLSNIVNTAKQSKHPIKLAFDAISEGGSQGKYLLWSSGKKAAR
ncbi:MAG: hypothetical protein Q9170_000296 [Blastenia crenularia]